MNGGISNMSAVCVADVAVTTTAAVAISYTEMVSEILNAAKQISVMREAGDGRIDSAKKEEPFLRELSHNLLTKHPTWDITISPPRSWYDIEINGLPINLKLTDCKTADNAANKRAIFFSITGLRTYPTASKWNDFHDKLLEARPEIKRERDRQTEYHYLVKNKLTGDALFKPIFDIHRFVSNPSNDLQINWRHEFEHVGHVTEPEAYAEKVRELLACLQRSAQMMIENTQRFATADFKQVLE